MNTQALRSGTPDHARRIPVIGFGLALSSFLLLSFVLCVAGYLIAPGLPITHSALSLFLPGFQLLSWPGFFVGAVESVLWGWYIALVFGSLYNFFTRHTWAAPRARHPAAAAS